MEQGIVTVDRRDRLSYQEFFYEYVLPGKPVVLTGLMDDWPARQKWTFEFFKTQYGDVMVPAQNNFDFYDIKLGEYIDYITLYTEEEREMPHLYVKDWIFWEDCPELLQDYSLPSHFRSWLDWVPRFILKPYVWLYIGAAGTGSVLHQDNDATHAWNAVFCGQKHWIFFSPEQESYLYEGRVNAFAPDYKKYPLFAKAQAIHAIQKPGDIVYTPSGWWHQVRNEANTIALTGSFVNRTNFLSFIREHWKRRRLQHRLYKKYVKNA